MSEELEQLLKNLHLRKMQELLEEELRRAEKQQIPYHEFLLRLVRPQWHAKQQQALEWRIKRARLPERWALETFPFKKQPGVNRRQIKTLAELDFIPRAENVVFIGPTDLLLIDEMGYLNLRPEQINIFFKLMEERYNRRATLITTNLEYDEWHQFLGNKPMVEALLSRLRHRCHTLRIDGPSLREPQS